MTAGLEFIPENGGGAGIRFRERRDHRLSAPSISVDAGTHYRLRLLSTGPCFYRSTGALRGMVKRNLITTTGRVDQSGREEWAITETGLAALHSKAAFPVIADGEQQPGFDQDP